MNLDNLVLRPNCLMTKYPVVFVTGMRSLFFYPRLGSELQDFIKAHGYVVLSPPMPFRSKNLRFFILKRWLKNQSDKRFHFILSEKSYEEFKEIFEQYPESTFTIVPKDLSKINSQKMRTPLSYLLHKLYFKMMGLIAEPYSHTLPDKSPEFYDGFLDHCIELAENEPI
jgi:hypothetical protein